MATVLAHCFCSASVLLLFTLHFNIFQHGTHGTPSVATWYVGTLLARRFPG